MGLPCNIETQYMRNYPNLRAQKFSHIPYTGEGGGIYDGSIQKLFKKYKFI